MEQNSINIRPGVRMLELFASLPYKEWYAIGELVDNAIQSYVVNKPRLLQLHSEGFVLHIDITVEAKDGGRVEVKDNASGISAEDWTRALRVGVPPSDPSGLSQFGVGMKAAACWFAHEWSISSAALGESVSRVVRVDVDSAVESEDEWVAIEEYPKPADQHGTVVTLRNLRRKPWGRGVQKIKTYLASIYREFLRDGDVVVTYNGEQIYFEEQPVLTAPTWNDNGGAVLTWRRSFEFELDSGKAVSGWAAVRETGRQASAGLALKYRRKVIVGAADAPYKPAALFGSGNSFHSQRLFGEVDISAFGVSHTKDAVLWDGEEDEFVARLAAELRDPTLPIYQQADNYRAPKTDPLPVAQLETLGRHVEARLADFPEAPSRDDGFVRQPTSGHYLDEEGVDLEETMEVFTALGPVDVTVRLVRHPTDPKWLRSEIDSVGNFAITVNRSHQFMRQYCEAPVQELEPVWLVAVAIAMGVRQAELEGAQYVSLVVEGVNEYVRRLSTSQQ